MIRRSVALPAPALSQARRVPSSVPDADSPPPVSAATRRDLFGTMGAMLLLTAAEAGEGKASELDGDLMACCAEAEAFERHAAALIAGPDDIEPGPAWDEHEALINECCALFERAAKMRARTPEGMQAKAKVILARQRIEDGFALEFGCSLARDVLGRAAA